MSELLDPDADEIQAQYQWDLEIQRQIISLLIADRGFLLSAMDLIKPNYFTNKVHQKIFQILNEHFHKYKVTPNRFILSQEIQEKLRDDKSLAYYMSELSSLFDYFDPGLDTREYLLDKIVYFAKIRRLRLFIKQSLEKLSKDPEKEEVWDSIYADMREVSSIDRNFNPGLDYFKSYRQRYSEKELEDGDIDVFTTSFPEVDRHLKSGGLIRGEIGAFVADSGVGKSRALQTLVVENVKKGKKTLYITLELSEKRVADRFDAMVTDSSINSLMDQDIKGKVLNNLKDWEEAGRQLLIKSFPAGTATVDTFRAYLSQMKFHGFIFDLVIVDYIGEMKDYPNMKIWDSRERMVKELRGLAQEENVCIFTAMQTNRSASELEENDVIDKDNLGDSYGQIRVLDGAWSLNKNIKEQKITPNPLGRLFEIKHREGEDRHTIRIEFDRKTLKIKEVSNDYYISRLTNQVNKTIEDVATDITKQKENDNDSSI